MILANENVPAHSDQAEQRLSRIYHCILPILDATGAMILLASQLDLKLSSVTATTQITHLFSDLSMLTTTLDQPMLSQSLQGFIN